MSKKKSTRKTRGSTKKAPRRKAPSKRARPATTKKKKAASRRTASSKVKAKDRSKRMPVLHAAVRVLTESGRPMKSKEITEVMLKKGYWTTKGKTPWATLYSAMLREIQNKSSKARFQKTERGTFSLRKGA